MRKLLSILFAFSLIVQVKGEKCNMHRHSFGLYGMHPTEDPDITAPGAVSDLSADFTGYFSARLNWTSPGDDGELGTASSYEIRLSTTELNASNFKFAIKVSQAITPSPAGSREEFVVQGLSRFKKYYFAIISLDESGNQSDISNILQLTTTDQKPNLRISMDQFMGTNGFIDVPVNKFAPVSFVREYHPWDFTEPEDDLYEYNRWNGFWDFDKFYRQCRESGLTVCPAIFQSPSWMGNASDDKPVTEGEDSTDPFSYSEFAECMFQYAARYGSVKIDPSRLKLAPGQKSESGLGYLEYYEDWNEQDKDWSGAAAYFSPAEYAAMASANIDGHGGSMAGDYGIKTADPGARFVMGGTAGLGTGYIQSMYNWFTQNRPDHDWPVDVINMHHYSTNGSTGISPESDKFKDQVLKVADWRDAYAPESQVWITEFGYDTNGESIFRAPVFGGFDQEEVQAQWILRTYLLLVSTGIDRLAQFMLRDSEPGGTEPRFRDCGFTSSPNTGYIPKKSWYYTHCMKNSLKNMYFSEAVTENPDVYLYKFTTLSGDSLVYAAWCPTSTAQTIEEFAIHFDHPAAEAELIEPVDESLTGEKSMLEILNSGVSIRVGEKPVFVVVSAKAASSHDRLASGAVEIELNVFPNPAYDILNLKLTCPMNDPANLSVYNSRGELVIRNSFDQLPEDFSIQVGDLPPGIYFISVESSNKYLTNRFIKQ